MDCRERQHDIVLYLYEELSDEARRELRAHLDDCAVCRTFLEREERLHVELTEDFSEWQVPADLLVECRRGLSDGLDRVEPRRSWWRWPLESDAWPRMRLLESAALLSIGLAGGVYVTNLLSPPVPEPIQAAIPQDAAVTNLRIIESDPATGEVELAGEMVQPMRVRGNIEDDSMQNMLVGALQSPVNPGVRLGVVELLSANPADPGVKQALMRALLSDDNPGVRWGALQALEPFARDDDVRGVLRYVVQNDDTLGIRVQAQEAMAPMSQEEAMAALVDEVTRDDPNAYIRALQLSYVGGQ